MRQPSLVVPSIYETPPTDMMLPSARERVLVPLTMAEPAFKTQTDLVLKVDLSQPRSSSPAIADEKNARFSASVDHAVMPFAPKVYHGRVKISVDRASGFRS